jgi:hypothetical protein
MSFLDRLMPRWGQAAQRPPLREPAPIERSMVCQDPVLACERMRELADEAITRLFDPDIAGWHVANARYRLLPLLQAIRGQAQAIAPYAGEPPR